MQTTGEPPSLGRVLRSQYWCCTRSVWMASGLPREGRAAGASLFSARSGSPSGPPAVPPPRWPELPDHGLLDSPSWPPAAPLPRWPEPPDHWLLVSSLNSFLSGVVSNLHGDEADPDAGEVGCSRSHSGGKKTR